MTGSPAHVEKTARAVREQGVDVEIVELDTASMHLPHRLIGEFSKAAGSLAKIRPSVAHCHGHIQAAFLLPAAKTLRVPVLCEVHGLFVASGRGGVRGTLSKVARSLEGPVLKASDHVVAQGEAMKARIVGAFGISADKVSVIYPGLRTEEFTGWSGTRAEIPGVNRRSEKVAMYVGSTHSYQGLDILAASQGRLGEDVRIALVLSSDDGSHENVVRKFGFDPRRTVVVRPGSSGLLPAYLAAADVLVHARPDSPENVNVQSKIGLYLASGKPVVASNVGDYRMLLGGSPGCILAPPTPEGISSGIREALSRTGIGPAALAGNPPVARKYFETYVNAARLCAVYRDLGGGW